MSRVRAQHRHHMQSIADLELGREQDPDPEKGPDGALLVDGRSKAVGQSSNSTAQQDCVKDHC